SDAQAGLLAHDQALFPGLVVNEEGEEARVVAIGGVAHYAIRDGDFYRHVEASEVDEAVLVALQETLSTMRDEVVSGVLGMMGTDDVLAKAAIEASIDNVGHSLRRSDPTQWAPMLRMYGFRIVVDIHGSVREIVFPAPNTGEDLGD
ncbi:MAG: hypothetical protein GXY79_07205, partial [Chloroflexi bacterium]|nr:hypothetical protein [Chloroflexota bacterium]